MPAPDHHVSENLALPRHAPAFLAGVGGVGSGWASSGWPAAGAAFSAVANLAGPETAIVASSHGITAARLAALRLLADEHVATHGGALRLLVAPAPALLIRTARDHAEALDARLRLLLGEDAVTSFDVPEQAEALSEHLASERRAEPGFALSLAAPTRPLLRLAPPLEAATLDAILAELDAAPNAPPPLLTLPLTSLRDDAFLRFAARHRRRAGTDAEGLVAAVPLAELLAAPDAARRAAAALAHAGHRLAAALQPQALRLFDPSTTPASLLVTPWDPAWQRDDPALGRAGPARVLATGVDTAAAVSACRAAGIGAIAGRAAARLLATDPLAR